MLIVGNLAIVGKHSVQNLLRFQGVEHRLQRIIHRQHVGDRAAGRQRQDDFSLQRPFREQVEQRLQRAGKEAL
ncbi:Uncharacterised protein [Raoultella ornithinolytica]|nr:Uncharacterised protein [Raoultella ornithinolytica]